MDNCSFLQFVYGKPGIGLDEDDDDDDGDLLSSLRLLLVVMRMVKYAVCHTYAIPDAVKKHKKSKLGPEIEKSKTDVPLVVPITGYTSPRKRSSTPGEIEDKAFTSRKSGVSITSAEEWPDHDQPEYEHKHKRT